MCIRDSFGADTGRAGNLTLGHHIGAGKAQVVTVKTARFQHPQGLGSLLGRTKQSDDTFHIAFIFSMFGCARRRYICLPVAPGQFLYTGRA